MNHAQSPCHNTSRSCSTRSTPLYTDSPSGRRNQLTHYTVKQHVELYWQVKVHANSLRHWCSTWFDYCISRQIDDCAYLLNRWLCQLIEWIAVPTSHMDETDGCVSLPNGWLWQLIRMTVPTELCGCINCLWLCQLAGWILTVPGACMAVPATLWHGCTKSRSYRSISFM